MLAGLQGARQTAACHLLGERQPGPVAGPTALPLWALISLSVARRRGQRGAAALSAGRAGLQPRAVEMGSGHSLRKLPASGGGGSPRPWVV